MLFFWLFNVEAIHLEKLEFQVESFAKHFEEPLQSCSLRELSSLGHTWVFILQHSIRNFLLLHVLVHIQLVIFKEFTDVLGVLPHSFSGTEVSCKHRWPMIGNRFLHGWLDCNLFFAYISLFIRRLNICFRFTIHVWWKHIAFSFFLWRDDACLGKHRPVLLLI